MGTPEYVGEYSRELRVLCLGSGITLTGEPTCGVMSGGACRPVW